VGLPDGSGMIWIDTTFESDDVSGEFSAFINSSGNAIVHGHVELDSGGTSVRLVAENRGSSATCASNDDGGLELTELKISFRVERSSERLTATVVPDYEENDELGRVKLRFSWDNRELPELSLWAFIDHDFHPGRDGTMPER
jgi:hypothetical protein